MKRALHYITFVMILLCLSGCAENKQLEMADHAISVDVTQYDMQMGNEVLSSVHLRYEFSLKNTGNTAVGGMRELNPDKFYYEDGLQYTIEPSEALIERSKEILGYNVFEDVYKAASSLTPLLKSDETSEGDFISFFLGVEEDTVQQVVAPSTEKLALLEELAHEAELVVSVKEEEIARFSFE